MHCTYSLYLQYIWSEYHHFKICTSVPVMPKLWRFKVCTISSDVLKFALSALVMLVQPAVSSVPAGDLGDPEYKVARQPLRHCHDQDEEEGWCYDQDGKGDHCHEQVYRQTHGGLWWLSWLSSYPTWSGWRVRFCDTYLFSSGLRSIFLFWGSISFLSLF